MEQSAKIHNIKFLVILITVGISLVILSALLIFQYLANQRIDRNAGHVLVISLSFLRRQFRNTSKPVFLPTYPRGCQSGEHKLEFMQILRQL